MRIPPNLPAPPAEVDLVLATEAATQFLKALGLDVGDEPTADTPARMARAYAELLAPRPFELTTFPNDAGYRHLVLQRRIPLRSLCEHHLLPFVGTVDLAYVPGERIVGLSKLSRLVEAFAMRPQVQERLTEQIAAFVDAELVARGVGVVVRAEHTCLTLRGASTPGVETVTLALRGCLERDEHLRREFLQLTRA
jgi:GTP cyclohydrolase IA